MASKQGVTIIVAGEDKSGEVFRAVQKHLADTQVKAKETGLSFGEMGEMLKHGLETAGIAIGLQEVVSQFKEMVKSTIETAVEIGHLNQQTGISVENLSMLKYAAQATGVDFEVLTRGFKKLAVTVYDADNGNAKAAKGFQQLGISVEELRSKGNDMYGVLELLADKFSQLPEGIAKSDAAAKIFGTRMGAEMIPILNEMGGKLEELKGEANALGIVWDEQGIRKMEEMRHEAVMLEAAWKAVGMRITEALSRLVGVSPATMQAERATSMGKALPEDIAGASDPGRVARREGGEKFGLQKELQSLEELHSKKHISEEEYRKKKQALEKKWNEADLRENQAYFVDLNDQITRAESNLANVKSGSAAWQKHEQEYLADLLKQQADAMDRIEAAKKRIDSSAPIGSDKPEKPGKAPKASDEGAVMTIDTDALDIQDQLWKDFTAKQREEFRRDSGAWFQDEDWKKMLAGMDANNLPSIQTTLPNVVLGKQGQDLSALRDVGEKFAHSVFDPIFDVTERWDQRWKQLKNNLIRDLAQLAEGQLFGMLFGDPDGRGGRGLSGGSWEGNPNRPSGHAGLAGTLLSDMAGLFHPKGASVTSNGGVGGGAGTIATAAASLMQTGKPPGSGGVQVVIQNQGPPMQATAQQQAGGDGGEAQVIQIMMKQMESNGPIAQAIMGLLMVP
jgi:hypothetical protein